MADVDTGELRRLLDATSELQWRLTRSQFLALLDAYDERERMRTFIGDVAAAYDQHANDLQDTPLAAEVRTALRKLADGQADTEGTAHG